eukprot:TRINITY_DN55905_c0_g1_i1.p1 TRINITY_DN55905_c0_g1~~TRINITY_DN55905_c0_g1_i1.p1  ORF type:complete len:608 (-),score=105.46 TRINITY_DN55905_c0_g1_i1:510-2333(-)
MAHGHRTRSAAVPPAAWFGNFEPSVKYVQVADHGGAPYVAPRGAKTCVDSKHAWACRPSLHLSRIAHARPATYAVVELGLALQVLLVELKAASVAILRLLDLPELARGAAAASLQSAAHHCAQVHEVEVLPWAMRFVTGAGASPKAWEETMLHYRDRRRSRAHHSGCRPRLHGVQSVDLRAASARPAADHRCDSLPVQAMPSKETPRELSSHSQAALLRSLQAAAALGVGEAADLAERLSGHLFECERLGLHALAARKAAKHAAARKGQGEDAKRQPPRVQLVQQLSPEDVWQRLLEYIYARQLRPHELFREVDIVKSDDKDRSTIDTDEFSQWFLKHLQVQRKEALAMLAEIDKNGDGSLSYAEWIREVRRRYASWRTSNQDEEADASCGAKAAAADEDARRCRLPNDGIVEWKQMPFWVQHEDPPRRDLMQASSPSPRPLTPQTGVDPQNTAETHSGHGGGAEKGPGLLPHGPTLIHHTREVDELTRKAVPSSAHRAASASSRASSTRRRSTKPRNPWYGGGKPTDAESPWALVHHLGLTMSKGDGPDCNRGAGLRWWARPDGVPHPPFSSAHVVSPPTSPRFACSSPVPGGPSPGSRPASRVGW